MLIATNKMRFFKENCFILFKLQEKICFSIVFNGLDVNLNHVNNFKS